MHSNANVMETSTAELNALQSEFRRIYGPDLEDLPNKNSTLFIFVQQGFENVAVMMDYIIELGIKREHIFMTTKPHTTSETMLNQFKGQVGHYVDFQWDAEVRESESHYSQKITVTNQILLDEVMSFLNHQHGQGIENILVLDEGGRFLSLAAPELKAWRDHNELRRCIITVEHTMGGTRDFDCSTLDFPYILMADCFLKTRIEAQYVAEEVMEASRGAIRDIVDENTVFGVIGCGNVGRRVVEMLAHEYPHRSILISDLKSAALPVDELDHLGLINVEHKDANREVFKFADIIFGCTGEDITDGLDKPQIAGNFQHTTLISCSSGDREFRSLLLSDRSYRLSVQPDLNDISMNVYRGLRSLGRKEKIIIKNGGFPINFHLRKAYGIAPDKVGITLAMKVAAVNQALELFSLFQLAQNHDDPEKREWLTRYMMLDPRLQQIILENHAAALNAPLHIISEYSRGDGPMTKGQITGEVVLTNLLRQHYHGRGTIPLMFHEEELPMDQAFIRLRIKSHARRQEHYEGYWPLEHLFSPVDMQRPIRHIVIEGEPGIGKTTLSQFIGFACFNSNLYEQVFIEGQEEGVAQNVDERFGQTSLLLKEVNHWASLFKGVVTLRLRDLNQFNYDITQVNPEGTDRYTLAQYQLAEFILTQHNLQQNIAMGESLKERAETLLNWLYAYEAEVKPRDYYLLVLDGYDELTAGMYQNPEVGGHAVLCALLDYPFWILTSRPRQVDEALVQGGQCDRHLMLDGFSSEDVKSYMRAVIPRLRSQVPDGVEEIPPEERVESLMVFLENHTSLKQLTRVPICSQLVCYLWSEAQARLENMEQLTPALLYKEIVVLLATRARLRQTELDHEFIEDELIEPQLIAEYYQAAFHALAELSFAKQTGDVNNQLVVSHQDLLALGIAEEIQLIITRALHLLKPVNAIEVQRNGFRVDHARSYEFTHLSFQEFLAANELVRQLASHQQGIRSGAIDFVRQKKYNQRYHNMLGFASSIVMEDDCNLIWGGDSFQREEAKRGFWAGVRQPVNVAIQIQEDSPQHVALLIDLWVQMGNRITELPEREDARWDYDGLEEHFLGIVRKLFLDLMVTADEKRLVSSLSHFPKGGMGRYFPQVNCLCNSKITESLGNLSKCQPFIEVFCDDGRLMEGYERGLLELLNSDNEADNHMVYQCLNGLGRRVMPDSIITFFLEPLQDKTIHGISVLGHLGSFLTDENGEMKEYLLAYLRDENDNVSQMAWNTLRQLGIEFMAANDDVKTTLLEYLNFEQQDIREAAWQNLALLGANFVRDDEEVQRVLTMCFESPREEIYLSALHHLTQIDANLAANWECNAAFAALQRLGEEFVMQNPVARQALMVCLNPVKIEVCRTVLQAIIKWQPEFFTQDEDVRQALVQCLNTTHEWMNTEMLCVLKNGGSIFFTQHRDVRQVLLDSLSSPLNELCYAAVQTLVEFHDGRSRFLIDYPEFEEELRSERINASWGAEYAKNMLAELEIYRREKGLVRGVANYAGGFHAQQANSVVGIQSVAAPGANASL